jgi:glycine C-acetyltransferase
LADRYDALVMVDDSHATGFVGAHGRGTHELQDVMNRVDILTGTLGKALGGASGGYTSGRKEIIAWLRQRSRPYLFSNSIPPMIAAATLKVLEMISPSPQPVEGDSCPTPANAIPALALARSNDTLSVVGESSSTRPVKEEGAELRQRLFDNAKYFREAMGSAGFRLVGAGHPIIPVMLGDAALATEFSKRMMARGVLAVGFSFPVVPQNKARIRTQMSAAHTREQLQQAVDAFVAVSRELGIRS